MRSLPSLSVLLFLVLSPYSSHAADQKEKIPASAKSVKCVSAPAEGGNKYAPPACVGDHVIRVMTLSMRAKDVGWWKTKSGTEIHTIDFGDGKRRCWVTLKAGGEKVEKLQCTGVR